MTYREHWEMIKHSAKLVAIGILALLMTIGFIFANAALAQWRVDVNVARRDAVMQIIRLEDNK